MQRSAVDAFFELWETLTDEQKISCDTLPPFSFNEEEDLIEAELQIQLRLRDALTAVRAYQRLLTEFNNYEKEKYRWRNHLLKLELEDLKRKEKRPNDLPEDTMSSKRVKKDDGSDQTLCCNCLEIKRCITYDSCGHKCCESCVRLGMCPHGQMETKDPVFAYLPQ